MFTYVLGNRSKQLGLVYKIYIKQKNMGIDWEK